MNSDDFSALPIELDPHCKENLSVAQSMTFEDKVLMVFIWITQYPRYFVLATTFGVSISVVSRAITETLPLLVGFFSQYIPNKVESDPVSHLSNRIIKVVGSTIHPTLKPSSQQHKWYNGHYRTHGILTQLLVDFDGSSVMLASNLKGHSHGANIATYITEFKKVLGSNLAL
jgi:hypothetical protein